MGYQTLCSTFQRHRPDIACLIEFDDQWNRHPLPPVRTYVGVRGLGKATLAFASDVLERIPEIAEITIPDRISGPKEPKSSCVALLRHRASSSLILVAGVHLESGPPSNSSKIVMRWDQMRDTLQFLGNLIQRLKRAGLEFAVVLCGDFNAVREEFLHGNTQAFFETAIGRQGTFANPAAELDRWGPDKRQFGAEISENGELRLEVEGVDG